MNRVSINTSHPKLEIPRLFDDSQKTVKPHSINDAKPNEFKFTTESSMEISYDNAYQKLNPRSAKTTRRTPTSENWIG